MHVIFVDRSAQTFYHFPDHSHPYWEVMLTTKGCGYTMANRSRYSFYPGKILCIPPNTVHSSYSEEGFCDACISFDDSFLIGQQFKNDTIREFEDDANGTLKQLLFIACTMIQKNVPNLHPFIDAVGDAVYQFLLTRANTRSKTDMCIDNFEQLLIENIGNHQFDLSKAMEKTGFCKGHFRRIFKEAKGMAPVAYFNHLRIEYAKQQLQQYRNTFTIREIAAFSGFIDPYHFSKVFKKCEGISPSEYLRSLDGSVIHPASIPAPLRDNAAKTSLSGH